LAEPTLDVYANPLMLWNPKINHQVCHWPLLPLTSDCHLIHFNIIFRPTPCWNKWYFSTPTSATSLHASPCCFQVYRII